MDNLDNIRSLWVSARTSMLPEPDAVILAAKKYKNAALFRTVRLLAYAFILTLLLIILWCYTNPKMISTSLGEGFLLLAILILIGTNLNTLHRFYYTRDLNNTEFIAFLKKTHERQLFYHSRTQVLGLCCTTVGILLYLFETANQHAAGLALYIAVLIFLIILWLFIRPAVFKKQSAKLQLLIKQMENLASQIN